MVETATFFELRRCSAAGIFAVPYRDRHRRKPLRLLDGAIVEAPTPDQRCHVPDRLDGSFAIGHGGVAATIHHRNLGLIDAFVSLEGVFVLPSGDVAAVYGAEAVAIG